MVRVCWLRWALALWLCVCLVLAAEERKGKEREGRKRSSEAGEQAAKGGEADAKGKKSEVSAADLEAFRNSDDPDAKEVVALHDEIDRAYTELATARNVALGEDREAHKAEREAKALESDIKRDLRKLEKAADRCLRPLKVNYADDKEKYQTFKARGDQLAKQKAEKRAAAQYEQAERYEERLEALERQMETIKSFLQFESAKGIALSADDDDDDRRGAGSRGSPDVLRSRDKARR